MKRRTFLVRCLSTGVALSITRPTNFVPALFKRKIEPKRVAVIGTGETGSLHLESCLANDGVVVGALCDVNIGVLRSAADHFGISRNVPRFVDYRLVLACPEIEAVTVAVPEHSRAAIVRDACRAGKHVYVAPLWATTVAESKMIVDAASKGRSLVCQPAVDDDWDAAVTHTLLRESGVRTTQLHITARQDQLSRPSRSPSLSENFDQLTLAQELLDVGMPARISAIRGVDSCYGSGLMAAAVRFDFDQPEANHRKSLILQKAYFPSQPKEVVAHIATIDAGGRRFEYLVESVPEKQSVLGFGLDKFFQNLEKPHDSWLDAVKKTHLVNSYVFLGEKALQRGWMNLVGTHNSTLS